MVDFPYILKQLGTDCFNGQGWEKYDENLSHPTGSDLKDKLWPNISSMENH